MISARAVHLAFLVTALATAACSTNQKHLGPTTGVCLDEPVVAEEPVEAECSDAAVAEPKAPVARAAPQRR